MSNSQSTKFSNLPTESLKNMAIHFQDKLPVVISIGEGVAENTFSFIQPSHLHSIKIVNFSISDLKDRITQSLSNQDWNEVDWAKFWVKEFSRVLGYNQENYQLNKLDEYLKQKNSKIIILIDGLENIFSDLAHDNFQQTALKALIDNLPNKLTEIKQSNLGLIVFLHRDSLRKAIKQNSGQFESLYQ
jgi:hypothetical protein